MNIMTESGDFLYVRDDIMYYCCKGIFVLLEG